MGNTSRITVEELRSAIDANYVPVVDTVWHGIRIVIKKHLSMTESMEFVEGVVSSCFAADTGEYIPEVKDFLIRSAILGQYANFDLPEDLDERFDIVYSTDLVNVVTSHIESEHLRAMLEAIDLKIDQCVSSRAEELTRQVDEMLSGLEDIEKNFNESFGGIDAETITQMAGAIANGGFDETKLAQAVLSMESQKDGIK